MAVSSAASVAEVGVDDASRLCQFTKTKLCKFHVLGKCTKGTQCPFAHECLDLRKLPDLRCTKLCKTLMQTGQCLNRSCLYAHSKEQLRSTGAFHKTKLCRFMQTGHCTLGGKCNFAHSAAEMREPETIETLVPPPGLSIGLEDMVTDLLSDEDDSSDEKTKVADTTTRDLKPAYINVPGLLPSDAWSFPAKAAAAPAPVIASPVPEVFSNFEEAANLNSFWGYQNQLPAGGMMDFGCYPEGGNLPYDASYDWTAAAPWGGCEMPEQYAGNAFQANGGYSGWDWQLFGPSVVIDQTDALKIKSARPGKATPKMKSVRTSESTLCPEGQSSGSEGDAVQA